MTGPRILAIAYACMPDVGSEPGTGWAWARLAAGLGETWVLTRPWPDRRSDLLEALRAAPERDTLHIVEVEMPGPWRRKRWDPFRGAQRMEYLVWQLTALRTARRIAKREDIDLVWHLTFANVWMGSIGGLIGPRFVLGPVGGGVGPVWRFMPAFGLRGMLYEALRSLVRTVGRYLNPLARSAWGSAALILAQNPETIRWLPSSARPRTALFHNVALTDPHQPPRSPRPAGRPPTALFAGRLIPLKGVALAMSAMASLPDWRLILIGDGPDRGRLRDIATKAGVAPRVEFAGWVDRPEVLRRMREDADVMLFPSLHEEGGWVVGEALACGLPVVCLDRGGPPIVGGTGVAIGSMESTASNLVAALSVALASAAPVPQAPYLEDRREAVARLLRERGLLDRAG